MSSEQALSAKEEKEFQEFIKSVLPQELDEEHNRNYLSMVAGTYCSGNMQGSELSDQLKVRIESEEARAKIYEKIITMKCDRPQTKLADQPNAKQQNVESFQQAVEDPQTPKSTEKRAAQEKDRILDRIEEDPIGRKKVKIEQSNCADKEELHSANRVHKVEEPIEEQQGRQSPKRENLKHLAQSIDQQKSRSFPHCRSPSAGYLGQNKGLERESTIEQKFLTLQNANTDCHSGVDRKNRKNQPRDSVSVNKHSMWFYNEYFYSNYDRPFFKGTEMENVLKQVELEPVMKFKDFRLLQRAMGKPRLFNEQFINEQIENLNQSRKMVRHCVRQRDFRDEKYQDVVELTANRAVIALHPICGHLHTGSILAIYKENQHVVKFSRPELGTQKVLDVYISSELTPSKPSEKQDPPLLQHDYSDIVENIDHEAMAITIKLLQYKNKLVRKLKQYNDEAEVIQKRGERYQFNFLEEYGWLGTSISIVSMALRHIIAKFRLRGVFQNQEQIGKNFTALLLNPLNMMAKELDHSSEADDINASAQIRKLIREKRQNAARQTVASLLQKNKGVLDQNIKLPEERERIEKLLKSCVGILANLKLEGKDFNMTESNKYLTSLGENASETYRQHFNEIYDRLHGIVKKMREL